jgi:protein-tyrosine phosphatase
MKKVLFICTGNFYRSRFCEALFNYLSEKNNLEWSAFSRGLSVELANDAVIEHKGEISGHTADRLKSLGISLEYTGGHRTPLEESDLVGADLIYAAMEEEHRPMIREQFPEWEDTVNYWPIGDLWHKWTPAQTLGIAQILVRKLVNTLK